MAKRKALYPDTVEREYVRMLTQYQKTYSKALFDRFGGLRLDGLIEDITDLIEYVFLQASSAQTVLIARLPSVFMAVSAHQDKQWALQVKAGTGIDLNQPDITKMRQRFGVGVDVWRSEPWLVGMRDNWIAQNVSLIKDMPQKELTQVEAIIRSGVDQGTSPREIAKKLKAVDGIGKRRAELIARDQIGKANSALTKHRQQDLGIDSYEWLSSNDSRVRPSHAHANGNIYSWAKPPSITGGNHPGVEVNCRCSALPVFPDLD